MTLIEKINACYNIFRNKPTYTSTYGINLVRCVECEYKLKCDECFYKALYKAKDNCGVDLRDVVEIKYGTWKLHKDGSGTCDQCRFTQRGVWDYDNWQRYCGCCGAKMVDIKCED